MQSMRYGTLPLVTDVGGLHDTVIDVDDAPSRGTGIVVPDATSVALMDGLHRMVKAYAQPRRRAAMQRRGMAVDWSWKRPAASHVDWYRRLLAEPAARSV
jgi:starch synthase